MIVNRATLAAYIGCAPNSINAMVKRGAPCISRPDAPGRSWQFESGTFINWYVNQNVSAEDAQAREAKRARARNAVAKADLLEMKRDDLQRQLVRIEDIAPIAEAGDDVVKAEMTAFAERLGPLVAAETDATKIQALLKEGVNSALEAICEQSPGAMRAACDEQISRLRDSPAE